MRPGTPPADPRDVATAATLAFVTWRFQKPASLLEVGCGSGRLAAALTRLGHAVTAIDVHPEAVRAARAHGVPAVLADICSYEGEPDDGGLAGLVGARSLGEGRSLARRADRYRPRASPWTLARAARAGDPARRGLAASVASVGAGRSPASRASGAKREPFDGILFTRSLHHVHALGHALDRARALLRPGGWLILEEFAYTRMDRATARWFYDALELLVAAGRMSLSGKWHEPHADPLERWRRWHRSTPPLHSDLRMQRAVASRFAVVSTRRVPYLYRYATERLERTPAGLAAGRWLEQRETMHVEAGVLRPIGWRLEARAPLSGTD